MGRKSVVVVLLVLFAGLALLLWFIRRSNTNLSSDPFRVIPVNSCIILETSDLPDMLNAFTEGNRLFRELSVVPEMEKFTRKVIFLRDFAGRNDLNELFAGCRALFSFYAAHDGHINTLLAVSIPGMNGYRSIIKGISGISGTDVKETREDRLRIASVAYGQGENKDTIFLTFRSGLVVASMSRDEILLASERFETGADIRSVEGMSRLIGAAGKNEDKIYLIFKNAADLLKTGNFLRNPSLLDVIGRLAVCSEGDISIVENGFTITGYTETRDSGSLLYRFKSGGADELSTFRILPSSTIMFETVYLPEPEKSVNNRSAAGDSVLKTVAMLAPLMANEITRAVITLRDSPGLSTLTVFELSNRIFAEQVIAEASQSSAITAGVPGRQGILYFQPDDMTKVPIYVVPFSNLASFWLHDFYNSGNDTLVTFIDNYMVTGDTYSAITRVIYDNILNKTLLNDLSYRDFEQTLPSRAGYYFYCKPPEMKEILRELFSEKIFGIIDSGSDLTRQIRSVGFQMMPGNEMIFNTLSVNVSGEIREESGAEWETLLDTAACIKPFFFTNHNSGAKEIFIQDFRNNIYLINAAGRVLWKVRLSERILGQVFMIDYYGNGKNQIMFSGRNWLHLIDRNGNYVERFPVRLRSPASGPPALFDYDGNRQYRIIISGEDRQIYSYDKSGNLVRGWSLFRTEGQVKTPVRYFRVSGKDYLVAADDKNVYFIDRTGDTRFRLKEPAVKASGSEIKANTTGEPEIVFSSPDGTVNHVSFDGKIRKTVLRRMTGEHSFDFFDIDGDGFGEYLFIDRGILYLYDNDRSELFTRDFGTNSLEGPFSFIFSASDRKIGVIDNNKRLVYLVDKNGNMAKGFPLKGASAFSIGKFSSESGFRLIVGGDDNFLYNYRIDEAKQ